MHCWETRIRTVPVDYFQNIVELLLYMIDFDKLMVIVVVTVVVVVDNIVAVAAAVVVNYNQNQ